MSKIEIYQDYRDFYHQVVSPRIASGELLDSTLKTGEGSKGGTYASFYWQDRQNDQKRKCDVKGDSTLKALHQAYLLYQEQGEDAFYTEKLQTQDGLRTSPIKRFHIFCKFLNK